MKKIGMLVAILVLLVFCSHSIYAQTSEDKSEDELGVASVTSQQLHEELSMEKKLQLLTEAALKYDIPPEILKAIAFVETGTMQFKDGEPIISDDGGIGIMQVTNPSFQVDQEKLKYDTEYNIDIGAKILKSKWNLQQKGRIPTINDGNPKILENWYFAVMAYNGLSSKNDPSKYSNTYQDRVYQAIENCSQVEVSDFPRNFEITYDKEGNMVFPSKSMKWENAATETTQMFNFGEKTIVMNSLDPFKYNYTNIRQKPSMTSSVLKKAAYYTELEIISGPYIPSSSVYNQFVMYEIRGADFTGYVASSNLRKEDKSIEFKRWAEKKTADKRKKWTIKLSKAAKPTTVNPRNVYVVDDQGNGFFTKLTYDNEKRTITVEPESPYTGGKTYYLKIKDLASSTNTPLKNNILMPFRIQ